MTHTSPKGEVTMKKMCGKLSLPFAVATVLLLIAGTWSVALAQSSKNWPRRPFMENKLMKHATHAGVADTSVFAWGTGVNIEGMSGGTIAIRVFSDTTCLQFGGPSGDTTGFRAAVSFGDGGYARDTVAVDSIAIEVFLYAQAGTDSTGKKYRYVQPGFTGSPTPAIGDTLIATPVVGDSTRYALVDMDDSSTRLDGWFCTSLGDSTGLYAANKITPEGATSVGQFPYNVSRRVVFARAAQSYGGAAIPGSWLINNPDSRQRVGSANRNRLPDRWFFLPLNDAFGGPLRGISVINVGVLNRTPSYAYKVSAWMLGASN
jgi:hypothetical protein